MSEMWITLTSNSVWFWLFLVKPKGTIFAFVIYKCKFIFIVGFFFFFAFTRCSYESKYFLDFT